MTRPSRLYRNVGVTAGELFRAVVSTTDHGASLTRVSIHRGGSDLSAHNVSTVTLDSTTNQSPSNGRVLKLELTSSVAQALAVRCSCNAAHIMARFAGRIATQTAHDSPKGWRGGEVTAVSWSSLLEHSRTTWTLYPSASLSAGTTTVARNALAPELVVTWSGDSDTYTADVSGQTTTAAEWLRLVLDRGYIPRQRRDGTLEIQSLSYVEGKVPDGLDRWPLARSHVLSPIHWEQPVEIRTKFVMTRTTPTGQAVIKTDGEDVQKLTELDWTSTVATTEQWRRIYGWRAETWPGWVLPQLTIRLDLLIASDREDDRRAAGMLLGLEVGDWVPLAGDWPPALTGLWIAAEIQEDITPSGWIIRLALKPFSHLAGENPPAVRPRTWRQASGTWAEYQTPWKAI